ncbi:carboxypeptidase regulatory-like domain protein [Burkholderia diffusa]|uniref:Carboxypeptidase regulatory-like domain protein n=1 Tax=Burkholderia diffusa TaxID=488732 RepID=A0A6P2QZE1_9BURK|nr:carboxypeptidase regulatory-like domain protein [Burkholderia diffusa]
MLPPLSRLSTALLIATACVASVTTFNASAQPASGAREMQPYQLFSPGERATFCEQMHSAKTPEARRAIAQRMHDTMLDRANEQGVALPSPMRNRVPMMGGGMGMGYREMGCAPDSNGAATADNLSERYDHGIAYITGGVGLDEVATLRGIASRYSMRAQFASVSGESLSGVLLIFRKMDGTLVFSATSDGPYIYAKMPPGSYRVTATSEGVERKRTITVPGRGGISIMLTWPTALSGVAH